MEPKTYTTLEAFKPHFNALARGGYLKIMKPTSFKKPYFNAFCRVLVWFFVVLYNLQHLILVIQVRRSTERIVDILFILLTTLNTFGKQLAFNLRVHRIDKIIDVMNGVYFAATNRYHVDIMKENALAMYRILRLYHVAIFTCGILWTIFPLVNRALGENVQFTAYFPFDTAESPTFEIVLAYMSILITLQAYGNVTMDCTIVAFYSQAKTQIKMLRYDLEQLGKIDNIETKFTENIFERSSHIWKALKDEKIKIHSKLVFCVEHYRQIVWFVKEVESIFGEAMTVQFFVMAWVICMTVYKIVGLSIYSAEFVSMGVYLGCMLAQLFIYCYYGTQLKVESESVNTSLYCSNWLSSLPKVRRQMLIMMQYCSKPLTPRTAYVIPMSLETYISVLKSSYSLFTLLNQKH
ncbi:odorant receptor Or1-like [Bombyx mori]